MNGSLYLNGLRGIWKLLVILAAVLAMYFIIIIAMFDPELGAMLDEFSRAMPEMMAAMGMASSGNTLVEFLATYLYGLLMLVTPMIFSILVANRLVAKQVDSGAMACFLAAPISKVALVLTQLWVLLTGLVVLIVFCCVLGIVGSEVMFPGDLDVEAFLRINVGTLGLQCFIGSVCFFSSCLFNDTKYSLGLGAGLPLLCYVIHMLANVGNELEAARYATFFTLFDPQGIIATESAATLGVGILFIAAAVLFGASVVVFANKDIPV